MVIGVCKKMILTTQFKQTISDTVGIDVCCRGLLFLKARKPSVSFGKICTFEQPGTKRKGQLGKTWNICNSNHAWAWPQSTWTIVIAVCRMVSIFDDSQCYSNICQASSSCSFNGHLWYIDESCVVVWGKILTLHGFHFARCSWDLPSSPAFDLKPFQTWQAYVEVWASCGRRGAAAKLQAERRRLCRPNNFCAALTEALRSQQVQCEHRSKKVEGWVSRMWPFLAPKKPTQQEQQPAKKHECLRSTGLSQWSLNWSAVDVTRCATWDQWKNASDGFCATGLDSHWVRGSGSHAIRSLGTNLRDHRHLDVALFFCSCFCWRKNRDFWCDPENCQRRFVSRRHNSGYMATASIVRVCTFNFPSEHVLE